MNAQYVYTHLIELLVKKHGWDETQIPLVTKYLTA